MDNFESKKRQILDRVDIVDLVSEQVVLKQRGQRWVGLCPFHAEKTPSFTVTPALGIYKCFGCGAGGDVFSFVQARENVPFMEAMRILGDRAGVEIGAAHASGTAQDGIGRAAIARVNAWALAHFRKNLAHKSVGSAARQYLQERRVTDEVVDRFDLGLATGGSPSLQEAADRAGIGAALLLAADLVRKNDQGRLYDTFRHRLMFPIRDATNRVVGFGGRTLVDDKAKYINTRQNALFDKGRGLYGIDLAREAIGRKRRAVAVEGYMDALACHQAEFTETVATLGTALTDAQVDLLRRYADEVILLFDSDDAGDAAAERAIHVALPRCLNVRLARIPEGKDPAEFLLGGGQDAFSDVLNQAIDALEFKWSVTLRRFGGTAPQADRRQAVLDFLGVVGEACRGGAVDVIQRGLMVNQVAHLLQMEGKEVDHLLTRLQGKRTARQVATAGRKAPNGDTVPSDAEQAAWVHVLEVVLNSPTELSAAGELPPIERIVDAADRRIARAAIDLGSRHGEFTVMQVLAQLDNPADAERVAALAQRGLERGNYAARFATAVERIRRAAKDEEMELAKRELLNAQTDDGASDLEREQLANLHRALSEQRSAFSGRRLIRQSTDDAGLASTGASNE